MRRHTSTKRSETVRAMDELVGELHVKPQKWAGMATDGRKVTRSEWGATTFPNGEQLLTARFSPCACRANAGG